MRPAFCSTLRCREIAGWDTWNGSASSATVASPSVSRVRIARRVGSASAPNTRLSWSAAIDNHLVLELISYRVPQPVLPVKPAAITMRGGPPGTYSAVRRVDPTRQEPVCSSDHRPPVHRTAAARVPDAAPGRGPGSQPRARGQPGRGGRERPFTRGARGRRRLSPGRRRRGPSPNAGDLTAAGGCQALLSVCRCRRVVMADRGCDLDDPQVGAGLAGRVLVPAAERGFDPAGADAWPAGRVQAGQDGPADVPGQVARAVQDVAGAGDQGLGCFDGDLVAGPVGVGARDGG